MKQTDSKITDLLSLLTFTLFALCLLGVLLTGAGVYRKLVARGEVFHRQRTALQYIATRVRQTQTVEVADFGGSPALVLGETIDGTRYVTCIYRHEGMLMELFSRENAQMTPEDGEILMNTGEIAFFLEGNLLTVEAEGKSLTLYVPAGKEAAP